MPLSFEDELEALAARGLRRALRPLVGPQGVHLGLEQPGGLHRVLNLCSNDYLGLASHAALRAAAHAAIDEEGLGAGASRLIAGNLRAHRRAEEALADWKHAEAALLFGSGYQANVGALAALLGPEDAAYSDALNHASLIDGLRLSRATVRIYPHRDAAALARLLEADHARAFRRRLVVTESLFSMDGDLAPLPDLAHLARAHDALLYIDDAHAGGVLGPEGRGLAALHDVRPDVEVGTHGKALGVHGAFVTGSRALCDLLVHRARSFVFTTAQPPALAAAAAAAVHLVRSPEGERRRRRLADNVATLRAALVRAGVSLPPAASPLTPILPLTVGDPARTMELSERLLAAGIFVQGIRPPTVPAGTSRLRVTVSSEHAPADLERAAEAISAELSAPGRQHARTPATPRADC